MIYCSELEPYGGDCSEPFIAGLPQIDTTAVDHSPFEGLDHSILEAIRDEGGAPSVAKLSLLIGGYRQNSLTFDDHTTAILKNTEKVVIGLEERAGKYVGWGGYAVVLSGAMYLESTQTN